MSQKQWTEDKPDGLIPRNGHMEYDEERGQDSGVDARTVRGRLIQEMQANNVARSNLRVGGPNRMAKYDMGASAKVYGLRALATIVEIMENVEESSAVRLAAAREVLDRGFGRPKQSMEVGGVDGDEIRNRLIIEFVGVPKREPQANEAWSGVPQRSGATQRGEKVATFEDRQGYGEEREEVAPLPHGYNGARDLSNDLGEADGRRGRGAPTKKDLEEAGVPDWRVLPRGPRKTAERSDADSGATVRGVKEVIRNASHMNQVWAQSVVDVEPVERVARDQ